MRRTLTVVLLTSLLAIPVCAQRRGFSSHSGGSAGARSAPSHFGARPATGFRGGSVGFSSGAGVRGGIAFGSNHVGNHGFRVIINPRPFRHPRWSVYPYRYNYSYVYPYVYYPAYPLSFYDNYDYMPTQPAYPYGYGYASGDDNYPPDYGLNEQMKQMGVGIYGQPRQAMPQTTPEHAQQAPVLQQPERAMPATVLVYRDGRRTEVRNYAIVGQTLWTFNERSANKVPLDELDLAGTRKANDERGVEFIVPQ